MQKSETLVFANMGDDIGRYDVLADHQDVDTFAMAEVRREGGVSAAETFAEMLSDNNGKKFKAYHAPVYPGEESRLGMAVVTHLEVLRSDMYVFGHNGNKAQLVFLKTAIGKVRAQITVHAKARPTTELSRYQNMVELRDFCRTRLAGVPKAVCGDFNVAGDFMLPSLMVMKKEFASAYEAVHGKDPKWTYHTKLGEKQLLEDPEEISAIELQLFRAIKKSWPRYRRQPYVLPRDVLDHIFLPKKTTVLSAKVIGVGEEKGDECFSDHAGILAEF